MSAAAGGKAAAGGNSKGKAPGGVPLRKAQQEQLKQLPNRYLPIIKNIRTGIINLLKQLQLTHKNQLQSKPKDETTYSFADFCINMHDINIIGILKQISNKGIHFKITPDGNLITYYDDSKIDYRYLPHEMQKWMRNTFICSNGQIIPGILKSVTLKQAHPTKLGEQTCDIVTEIQTQLKPGEKIMGLHINACAKLDGSCFIIVVDEQNRITQSFTNGTPVADPKFLEAFKLMGGNGEYLRKVCECLHPGYQGAFLCTLELCGDKNDPNELLRSLALTSDEKTGFIIHSLNIAQEIKSLDTYAHVASTSEIHMAAKEVTHSYPEIKLLDMISNIEKVNAAYEHITPELITQMLNTQRDWTNKVYPKIAYEQNGTTSIEGSVVVMYVIVQSEIGIKQIPILAIKIKYDDFVILNKLTFNKPDDYKLYIQNFLTDFKNTSEKNARLLQVATPENLGILNSIIQDMQIKTDKLEQVQLQLSNAAIDSKTLIQKQLETLQKEYTKVRNAFQDFLCKTFPVVDSIKNKFRDIMHQVQSYIDTQISSLSKEDELKNNDVIEQLFSELHRYCGDNFTIKKLCSDFSKQFQERQKHKLLEHIVACAESVKKSSQKKEHSEVLRTVGIENKMYSLSPEHMSILNHEHDLHDLLPCATNHLNYALGFESLNICNIASYMAFNSVNFTQPDSAKIREEKSKSTKISPEHKQILDEKLSILFAHLPENLRKLFVSDMDGTILENMRSDISECFKAIWNGTGYRNIAPTTHTARFINSLLAVPTCSYIGLTGACSNISPEQIRELYKKHIGYEPLDIFSGFEHTSADYKILVKKYIMNALIEKSKVSGFDIFWFDDDKSVENVSRDLQTYHSDKPQSFFRINSEGKIGAGTINKLLPYSVFFMGPAGMGKSSFTLLCKMYFDYIHAFNLDTAKIQNEQDDGSLIAKVMTDFHTLLKSASEEFSIGILDCMNLGNDTETKLDNLRHVLLLFPFHMIPKLSETMDGIERIKLISAFFKSEENKSAYISHLSSRITKRFDGGFDGTVLSTFTPDRMDNLPSLIEKFVDSIHRIASNGNPKEQIVCDVLPDNLTQENFTETFLPVLEKMYNRWNLQKPSSNYNSYMSIVLPEHKHVTVKFAPTTKLVEQTVKQGLFGSQITVQLLKNYTVTIDKDVYKFTSVGLPDELVVTSDAVASRMHISISFPEGKAFMCGNILHAINTSSEKNYGLRGNVTIIETPIEQPASQTGLLIMV